jgi:hypothetical protein
MARHCVFVTALMVLTATICPSAQSASTGAAVKPTAVAKKTGMPPPVGAKPGKVVGRNKVAVSTANSSADDDSFWIERIDIDGDGDVEESHLIWDDEDKVLLAYSTGVFACRNGATATFDMLVASYGAGNAFKKPAGSGFWIADLDAGECGAQAAGLWGCKFDAGGNATTCGVATLDEKSDDITVVAEK